MAKKQMRKTVARVKLDRGVRKAIRELKARGLVIEINGRLYALDGKPITTVQ